MPLETGHIVNNAEQFVKFPFFVSQVIDNFEL